MARSKETTDLRSSLSLDLDLLPQKSNISLISNGSPEVEKPFDDVAWDRLPGRRLKLSAGFCSCRNVNSGWISGSSFLWDLGETRSELISFFCSVIETESGSAQLTFDNLLSSSVFLFFLSLSFFFFCLHFSTSTSFVLQFSADDLLTTAVISGIWMGFELISVFAEVLVTSSVSGFEVEARFLEPFLFEESRLGLLHQSVYWQTGFTTPPWPLLRNDYVSQVSTLGIGVLEKSGIQISANNSTPLCYSKKNR